MIIFVWIPKTAGTSICCGMDIQKIKIGETTLVIKKDIVTYGHGLLKDVVKEGYLSAKAYNDAFKFCFIRNPLDRFVSLYFYSKAAGRISGSFDVFCKEFVRMKIDPPGSYNERRLSQFNLQTCWIRDMDFIGRYEHLQEDYDTLCDILGLPQTKISHLNSSDHTRWEGYYNDKTRRLISDYYAEDLIFYRKNIHGPL